MRLNKTKILQRGDTIIEVLLAMSVIGLVLGSSYAIANRSLRIGREAQERTEALKLAETQLERLRTVSGVSGNVLVDLDPFTSAFCIDSSIEPVLFDDRQDFDSFTEVVTDEVNYPDGPASDQPCNQGTDGRYGITIQRSTVDNDFLYTIRVRWESIGGGPLQELQSQYRVYPVGNTAFESITPAPIPEPISDPDTPEAPVITAVLFSNISTTSANVEVGFSGDVNQISIVVSRDGSNETRTIDQSSGNFIINDLAPDTEYLVAATVRNNEESTSTDSTASFTTLDLPADIPVDPPVFSGQSVYYLSDQRYSWSEANDYARNSGGHLVTISSEDENSIVSSIADGNRVWIGLIDRGTDSQEPAEGWEWITGEPLTYTNWASGEPNDFLNGSPGEDVAVLNWAGGQWNDWFNNDSTTAYFVIEFEREL